MPLNISIHRDQSPAAARSERSRSFSDGEDSSGTGVQISPSSGVGSHEYPESFESSEDWVLDSYPDDIGPSDSASRPRTSNQNRPIVEAREAPPLRAASQRRVSPGERSAHRAPLPHRVSYRPRPPVRPESVDPPEEYMGYARGPPPPHARPHYRVVEGGAPAYSPSYSSGPGYSSYAGNSVVPTNASQLVPFASQGGYGYSASPFSPGPAPNAPGYFAPRHPGGGHMVSPMSPGGGPFHGGQEMMGYGQGGNYFYNQQGYGVPPSMSPPVYYPYQVVPPPATSNGAAPPRDDEKFARLEKILLDQKKAAEEKEAKAKKDAEEKAVMDAKAAEEAAAASKKAADEAAAAKDAADKDAAAAAAAAPPKEEKKKPIKFKDAVGRKFSFPFHLCNTWEGMEDLIRQAFVHVDVIGAHVAQGHYDLIGPNGDIIMPKVWETMIEPDWTITMHMWPIPEPPADGEGKEGEPKKGDGPEQVVLVGPGAPPNLVKAGKGAVVKIPAKGGKAGKKDAGLPPPPPPAPGAPPGGPAMPPGVEVVTSAAVAALGKKKEKPMSPFMMWASGGKKTGAKKVVVKK
ncbi:MAG: hypothetical protein M1817_001566 [Caeruleum heppii]|nr:MAG: hypothetical protein M1817_001566 [Caeruleum heppii]